MKRKSGLHKKVSSIFGDVPAPGISSLPNTLADNSIVPLHKDPKGPIQKKSLQTDHPAFSQFSHTASSSEDSYEKEIRKSQKRKAILMFALAIVFVGVIYFIYIKPSDKAVAKDKTQKPVTQPVAKSDKVSEIAWQNPEPWPSDIRDPMAFGNEKANLYAIGVFNGPVLKGIVYRPNGNSSVLIGKDILHVGEHIQDWKVVDILSNMVRLEKDDGEKLELKMK